MVSVFRISATRSSAASSVAQSAPAPTVSVRVAAGSVVFTGPTQLTPGTSATVSPPNANVPATGVVTVPRARPPAKARSTAIGFPDGCG